MPPKKEKRKADSLTIVLDPPTNTTTTTTKQIINAYVITTSIKMLMILHHLLHYLLPIPLLSKKNYYDVNLFFFELQNLYLRKTPDVDYRCSCLGKGCIICEFNDTNLQNMLPLNLSAPTKSSLQCPVCSQTFIMDEREMDKHVEDCLSSSVLAEESKKPIPTPAFT